MLISIITVVYNRVDFISKTIQSVLSQTYDNIEYIVVDGGSTDGTEETVRSFGSNVSKFISEADDGIYDALNKGIELATGDVIGVLHSDDVFADNNIIELIANEFKGDSTLDAVYGDVSFVRSENPEKTIRYFSSKDFSAKKFERGFMPAHPSFFCKRSCFQHYGNYRTDMAIGADFDLLLRFFAIHKIKTRYLPVCTTVMSVGGKSTSGIKSIININKDFFKALSDHGLKASYLKLYSRYFKKWKEFVILKPNKLRNLLSHTVL